MWPTNPKGLHCLKIVDCSVIQSMLTGDLKLYDFLVNKIDCCFTTVYF